MNSNETTGGIPMNFMLLFLIHPWMSMENKELFTESYKPLVITQVLNQLES